MMMNPFPSSVHMPKRDMLIRTIVKEKENPDSAISKYLRCMVELFNIIQTREALEFTAHSSEGAKKLCGHEAIPTENRPIIVDDRYVPLENPQMDDNPFIQQYNHEMAHPSHRVTFTDTRRGASSPLPHARLKRDTSRDREWNCQTNERSPQYSSTL